MGVKGLTITGKLKSQLVKSDASSDFWMQTLQHFLYCTSNRPSVWKQDGFIYNLVSFFQYFAQGAKLLEPVRFNKKKWQRTREMKRSQKKNCRKHKKWKRENLIYYQVNCSVFTNLIRLKSHTKLSSDQNIQKHGEDLGSKLTNHKMKKFPERSEVWLFSLQEALCFLLQCYWFAY